MAQKKANYFFMTLIFVNIRHKRKPPLFLSFLAQKKAGLYFLYTHIHLTGVLFCLFISSGLKYDIRQVGAIRSGCVLKQTVELIYDITRMGYILLYFDFYFSLYTLYSYICVDYTCLVDILLYASILLYTVTLYSLHFDGCPPDEIFRGSAVDGHYAFPAGLQSFVYSL